MANTGEFSIYFSWAGYIAQPQWQASHAYTVGQIVRESSVSEGNERLYICGVAGTSGSTQPSWSTGRFSTTTDGGVTWYQCAGFCVLNGDLVNCTNWVANYNWSSLGIFICNSAKTHVFLKLGGGGNTGSTEPTWNTTTGATTTDNSVSWVCLGPVTNFPAWTAPCPRLNQLNDASLTNIAYNDMIIYYVADNHAEVWASNSPSIQTYNNWPNRALICIDHTVAVPPTSLSALKTTATVTLNSNQNVTVLRFNPCYGIQFIHTGTSNNITLSAQGGDTHFDHCTFSYTNASNSGGMFSIYDYWGINAHQFDNCTFHFSHSAQRIQASNGVNTRLRNCTMTGTAPANLFTSGNWRAGLYVEACDLSLVAGQLLDDFQGGTSVTYNPITFKDCKLNAGVVINSSSGLQNMQPGSRVDLNRCDSAAVATRNERWTLYAAETTSTSVVRTGGAVDGATPVSHQITLVADNQNGPSPGCAHQAIPLVIWNAVTGSNRSVTVYGLVNDSRLPTNSEVWFDCEYLGFASSPLGSMVFGGTIIGAASLTADTSAWDSQVIARANSHAYTVGQTIKTASNSGRVFFCTTAGTSASSEPGGYASAVDGGSVTDGSATFRAGCRFSQTLTLSSPQPAQPGYLYCYHRFGRPSMTYYIDPMILLS